MIHLGDITQIKGCDIAPVDAVTGGSPCQDLSIAGKRIGLAGKRSGLFMEQIRVIKELRESDEQRGRTGNMVRPRYMVWENVPGAFSSNKREDFRAVLEETAKVIDENAVIPKPPKGKWRNAGCIMGDGWSIAWRVLDAQFWGVPQRRRRIALVADFGGESAPEILFERKGVSGDIAESRTAGERIAGIPENGFRAAGFLGKAGAKSGNIGYAEDIAPTLRVQTDAHVVYDCRGNGGGTVCPALTGDHQNRVTDYTAICIQGNGNSTICPDLTGGGKSYATFFEAYQHHGYRETNVSGTFTAGQNYCVRGDTPLILDARNITVNDISGTPQAKNNGGYSLNYINPVYYKNAVRRLTPLECERLQGYPDGWTLIPDYINSKGKRGKISDSARYKALGNSIALPQWLWILGRISRQYEDIPTLGSLFDGIGGFPLCWEMINGKGSAIWASEIEEFPIAATKYHFG